MFSVDDTSKKLKAGTWSRGSNYHKPHLWATPKVYTHPDAPYDFYGEFAIVVDGMGGMVGWDDEKIK